MMLSLVLAAALAVTLPSAPTNRISDQAQLLSAAQVTELEALFQDVETRQGVKFGLLTLPALDDDPKAVSVRTLNFWQMSPDSVLLLVSMNPRKVFLQPGNNLQYRFDERTAVGVIRDHIVPALKSGRYGVGILNGFHAVSQRLPGPAVAPGPNTPSRPEPVAQVADEGLTEGQTFLFVLLGAFGLLGGAFLIRYLLRRRREDEESERGFARVQRAYREDDAQAPGQTPSVAAADPVQARARVERSYVQGPGPTVINNNSTNLLVAQALTQPRQVVVIHDAGTPPPERHYTPPPTPPRPSRRDEDSSSSYSSSDSSWGGGGGGSSFDSGGGFDSSGGGGGGGSDF